MAVFSAKEVVDRWLQEMLKKSPSFEKGMQWVKEQSCLEMSKDFYKQFSKHVDPQKQQEGSPQGNVEPFNPGARHSFADALTRGGDEKKKDEKLAEFGAEHNNCDKGDGRIRNFLHGVKFAINEIESYLNEEGIDSKIFQCDDSVPSGVRVVKTHR